MAKYLDPKADVTFKKVFGEHKNLVISLLNALLPLDPGKQVETIEYMTSEMVPETPLGKNSIVDVRCEETGRRKFIVEMQMEWFPDFMQRVLLNASKAYVGRARPLDAPPSRRVEDAPPYQELPVYSLNLVNHTFLPDMDGYYHYYHLVHDFDSKKGAGRTAHRLCGASEVQGEEPHREEDASLVASLPDGNRPRRSRRRVARPSRQSADG